MTEARLAAEDWLLAGFRALVARGPLGIRAEVLARDLGVTKGSFYWHFKDMTEFRTRLLAYWLKRGVEEPIAQLAAVGPAPDRLRSLMRLAVEARDPLHGGAAAEPAIRAWARESAEVAGALAEVDARRVSFLADLCREAGLDEPTLPGIIYATYVGLLTLDSRPEAAEAAARRMEVLLDLALASSGGPPR